MVRGFEECLTGFEVPFAEAPLGCAVMEDSPAWVDDSFAERWSKSLDDGISALPTTVVPYDQEDCDLSSVMQQCIKVHGFVEPSVFMEFSDSGMEDEFGLCESASDFESMSDGLFSDTLSSDGECDSASEFAAAFTQDVVVVAEVPAPPPQPQPKMLPKRTASPRVRRPSRRLVDSESSMPAKRKAIISRKRSTRKQSALKVKKGGVRKLDTERMRVRAAARSRKEMKQVIKQFGATSTESRRRQHNVLERKRRCDLKSSYQDLRSLVPTLQNMERVPTGQILLAAIHHIRDLQQEDKELEISLMQLRDENKRLKRFVLNKA